MSDKPGVLEQESQRRQMWIDAGLPDPVGVLSEERVTRSLYGPRDFRSPRRTVIDAFVAEHGIAALPGPLPHDWKD